MSEEKTIEQRKAEHRFGQLSDKIHELCGENGSMICGIVADHVQSISMSGQTGHIIVLMGALIRQLAEVIDDAYGTADVLERLRECIDYSENMKEDA